MTLANEILMLLRANKKYSKEVSLYEPIGVDKDGETVSLLDVIEMENKETLETIILKQDIKELYEVFDSCLKDNEKTIIGMRYGLHGGREYTQREIADLMGISRSYSAVIIGIKIPGRHLSNNRQFFVNNCKITYNKYCYQLIIEITCILTLYMVRLPCKC